MAQRAAAPKFGDWETEEDVAYTMYFEKAVRGGSKGRMTANQTINKPDKVVNSKPPPVQASSFNNGSKKEQVVKSNFENGGGSQKKKLTLTHSAIQHTVGRGTVSSSHFLNHGGECSTSHMNNKGVEQSAAADPIIEKPPPHPRNQEKVGGKGNAVSSLPPERKGSSQRTNGQAPVASERPGQRAANRGKPDRVTAVPKFGDWDEKNPASADGFTHIFDKVIEERREGANNEPAHQTQTSVSSGKNQDGNKNSEQDCCCFPWKKKMFSWRRK